MIGGLIAAGAVALAWAALPTPAWGAAVAYQADVQHSGFVPDGPNPPLGRKWIRRDLGEVVSYPVIAEGRAFVTAWPATTSSSSSERAGPTLLYALDRRTGGTVWVREVATRGLPAYDEGRLYVLGTGALDAVSAANGERLWRTEMRNTAAAAPVPDGPFVYASDESAAYAVSSLTGVKVRTWADWKTSGFAVVGDRVYLARTGCNGIGLFTRGLAEPVWTRTGPCSTSLAVPPAYHTLNATPPNERIWARDSNGVAGLVVDALTSLGTEQFASAGGVSLAGEHGFLRRRDGIEARSQATGVISWRWPGPADEPLTGGTLAVRDAVWVLGLNGTLVALRRGDGGELFRTTIGSAKTDPYTATGVDGPDTAHLGMAADGEGLLVPNRGRLAALGPGGDAPGVFDADLEPGAQTSMSARASGGDIAFGRKVAFSGQVSRTGDSSVSDTVELQADPYPYGVWETVASRQTSSSGGYSLSHGPDRNTRYRVVDTSTAPAVVSKTFQVFVYPPLTLRLGWRGRGRIYVASSITAPDHMKLNGKPMYVYRQRSRRAAGTLIGRLKIRRVRGTAYRARGTVRVPGHRPETDYFGICFKVPNTRVMTRLNGRKNGCGRRRF